MNCKQGDLAIIVKSNAGNEGKIVRCLRLVGEARSSDGIRMAGECRWEIDRPIPTDLGDTATSVRDAWLRPIRDDLLNDEITTSKELEAA